MNHCTSCNGWVPSPWSAGRWQVALRCTPATGSTDWTSERPCSPGHTTRESSKEDDEYWVINTLINYFVNYYWSFSYKSLKYVFYHQTTKNIYNSIISPIYWFNITLQSTLVQPINSAYIYIYNLWFNIIFNSKDSPLRLNF